jgi:hypothetical protein
MSERKNEQRETYGHTLGPVAGSYWVQDRLVAGPYPGGRHEHSLRARLRLLLEAGVTHFLDLTESGEKGLAPYKGILRMEAAAAGLRIEYARAPIHDFDIPTIAQMREVLDLLDAAIAGGHTVYVHCYAGIGRTGTVVGCFLVRHGLSGREALDEIAALRRGLGSEAQPSPITAEQRAMVLNWIETDGVG